MFTVYVIQCARDEMLSGSFLLGVKMAQLILKQVNL